MHVPRRMQHSSQLLHGANVHLTSAGAVCIEHHASHGRGGGEGDGEGGGGGDGGDGGGGGGDTSRAGSGGSSSGSICSVFGGGAYLNRDAGGEAGNGMACEAAGGGGRAFTDDGACEVAGRAPTAGASVSPSLSAVDPGTSRTFMQTSSLSMESDHSLAKMVAAHSETLGPS
jgi:hypothetical protein